MKVSILTDSEKSWFIPFGNKLKSTLIENGHQATYVNNAKDISSGDICFLLSCTKLINEKELAKNKHNIVVHASDLPKGKGFSPLQWEILSGASQITLTLFEAVKELDAGEVYFKEKVEFRGTELLPELREKMALSIIEMCTRFVKNYSQMTPVPQTGTESFYPRRVSKDDELDPNKTIKDQFNHLRIADNDKYPLFFHLNGEKYILKIYKA